MAGQMNTADYIDPYVMEYSCGLQKKKKSGLLTAHSEGNLILETRTNKKAVIASSDIQYAYQSHDYKVFWNVRCTSKKPANS